ncbi:hypothetical protein MMARJ_00150 [Mycobacterium marseillense]|uniref:Uncharacterized protein n=1 Tax=Mycobacterium marseillense TaxID=701042 RepID=A0ABN5ZNM1_9MYCO|nr:hypothetical protein MMARJ_00150 [Mycobacterium marseillense]
MLLIAVRTSSGRAPGDGPPAPCAVGQVAEHLAREPAQQMALVLEVDVEAGAGDARLPGEPIHAELGKARAVAHQPFGGIQQPALHLFAPLLARHASVALRLASERRHAPSITEVLTS